MNSSPWLTVVMPTYNGQRYVGEALRSVETQEGGEEIEVVVVDDGSTDRTRAIVEEYSRRIPVRILEGAHTGNWVSSTNIAMNAARGKWICWLHQDDLWLPGRLCKLRSLADEHPESAIIVHAATFIGSDGQPLGKWTCPLPSGGKPFHGRDFLGRLLVQNFIATCAPIFRKDAALRVGLMDEDLKFTGDWDFWIRIFQAGKVLYHPRSLSGFRLHAESQTSEFSKQPAELRHQFDVVRERHLPSIESATMRMRVEKRSRLSGDITVDLAQYLNGSWVSAARALLRYVAAGPIHWYPFLRDSRLVERSLSRWRAGSRRWSKRAAMMPSPSQFVEE